MSDDTEAFDAELTKLLAKYEHLGDEALIDALEVQIAALKEAEE